MRFALSAMCLAWSAHLGAVTLSRLTLDDMINQSTAIVRARITGSYAAARGQVIYTFYQAQVTSQWKGTIQSAVEIALPGGTANGLRQAFPGTPQLTEGKEYLLFLWTSKSGLTQIIGLTQGVFDVTQDSSGVSTVTRGATSNSMLDPRTGQLVKDQAIQMQLKDLGVRIATTLGKGATN
jgi:hypothetical protein